jgi:hypothetical protein
MSDLGLRFLFKLDTIRANPTAVPESFSNGHYKPPIRPEHYEQLDSTGWLRWTVSGISTVTPTPPPTPPPTIYAYTTSIFYDGDNKNRFLFHPADCRTVDISDIERHNSERWGWQELCFTERDSRHCVLDLNGEYDALCGRPGSYSPNLLPYCYRSVDNPTRCGLSGNVGLLLALAAFSCRHDRMLAAIVGRLNFRERRWDDLQHLDWGNGRKLHL